LTLLLDTDSCEDHPSPVQEHTNSVQECHHPFSRCRSPLQQHLQHRGTYSTRLAQLPLWTATADCLAEVHQG